jgi:hypothetical protein
MRPIQQLLLEVVRQWLDPNIHRRPSAHRTASRRIASADSDSESYRMEAIV